MRPGDAGAPAPGAADRIRAAEARGEEWVLLEDVQEGGLFRRVELHVPTGVAVVAAAVREPDGRVVYLTESHFRNRRTGAELPCGSRRWNVGRFDTREELEQAVARAKADVRERFAGMIRVYQRRRAAQRSGPAAGA